MKFVHLAASLLLLNTGFLFAQSGYNGPAPMPSAIPEPVSSSATFQAQLEVDNFDRIQSPEKQVYFDELTSCLLTDYTEPVVVLKPEDKRLEDRMDELERKILLSVDEQMISDPEAEEEGMEQLENAVMTQQLGDVAMLSDQLSSVMTEYETQENESISIEPLLLEDFSENQEPIHWLVQVELGQVR